MVWVVVVALACGPAGRCGGAREGVMGSMAAFQQHPAPHPQGLDALDAALDEARKLGVPEVALG